MRAAARHQRVREQEHEHGHERVERVLDELGREEPAAHHAIDRGQQDRIAGGPREEAGVGRIHAGDEDEAVALQDRRRALRRSAASCASPAAPAIRARARGPRRRASARPARSGRRPSSRGRGRGGGAGRAAARGGRAFRAGSRAGKVAQSRRPCQRSQPRGNNARDQPVRALSRDRRRARGPSRRGPHDGGLPPRRTARRLRQHAAAPGHHAVQRVAPAQPRPSGADAGAARCTS